MAGLIEIDHSPEEGRSLISTVFSNLEDLIFDDNDAQPSLSSQTPIPSRASPWISLITTAPSPLELRQNNPQDCQNLITASVNRATVEISRTIIALNATFSQQLQEASISASNGIKQAQDSASSSIGVVVTSASIATSSAFSSLTLANLAVTSVNLALTSAQASASTALVSANSNLDLAQSTISTINLALSSVSSASSTDVSSLSARIALLQSSISSVQASASIAIAAAQSALASVTGSAAAQASSILASAAATQTTSNQPLAPIIIETPPNIFLTPTQIAAIIIGAVAGSILLALAVYFLLLRMKKKQERDSYLDEKDIARSPRDVPFRMSSTLRTGNGMKIKFNPPKRSDIPPLPRPAVRIPEEDIVASPAFVTEPSTFNVREVQTRDASSWKFPFNVAAREEDPFKDPPTGTGMGWPLISTTIVNDMTSPPVTEVPQQSRAKRSLDIFEARDVPAAVPKSTFEVQKSYMGPSADPDIDEETDLVRAAIEDTHGHVTPEEEVQDPFKDPIDENFAPQDVQERNLESVEETLPFTSEEPISERIEEPIQDETELESVELAKQQVVEAATNESSIENNPNPSLQPHASLLELSSLLPEQSTRIPSQSTLALLASNPTQDEQRNSTMPEIDILLRQVAQQNEYVLDRPLFWTDFRAAEPESELEMVASERFEFAIPGISPVKMLSPFRDSPTPTKRREEVQMERAMEILRRNSEVLVAGGLSEGRYVEVEEDGDGDGDRSKGLVNLGRGMIEDKHNLEAPIPQPLPEVEKRDPSTPPPAPIPKVEEREISPLRMNPQLRNIDSLIAENHSIRKDKEQPSTQEGKMDERHQRGRSMIRTSDLIEARLSAMNQLRNSQVTLKHRQQPSQQDDETEQEQERKERTLSPLRRNPVDLSMIPTEQELRDRTLSPLRRKLSNGPISREDSPLRRNPSNPPPLNILERGKSPLRRNPSLPSPSTTKRDDSPLRRNPPSYIPGLPLTIPTQSRSLSRSRFPQPSSFSQNLSIFERMGNEGNGVGGAKEANNEVVMRAVAGIYIPGSLREQAVRNRSRNRSRNRDRNRNRNRSLSRGGD